MSDEESKAHLFKASFVGQEQLKPTVVTDFVDQCGDDGQGRPLQRRVKGVGVRDENWGQRGKCVFMWDIPWLVLTNIWNGNLLNCPSPPGFCQI